MPPAAHSKVSDAPQPGERPIRVMIVDDSAVARAVLKRMISTAPELEVVAEATNAREALDVLSSAEVDIVLLDVEMPGTSGLDALPEILRRGRGARVLILSSLCEDGAEANVRALSLGAADTLPKPGAGCFAGRFSQVLVDRLRSIGRVEPHEQRRHDSSCGAQGTQLRPVVGRRLGCLALGASTGGLPALGEFLSALPRRIDAPILITQHLPVSFMSVFARQIEAASGRVASVATDGQPLEPEQILIAPGDAHLGLRRSGSQVLVELERRPAQSGHLPSVDRMVAAAAEIYGPSATAIILSGMGRDGLAGSHELAGRGGAIFVQDAESSTVWGMPRAVAEAGLASAVLPPAKLARRVADHAGISAWR
jgi:two-component system chemotaxis response regulator CheB